VKIVETISAHQVPMRSTRPDAMLTLCWALKGELASSHERVYPTSSMLPGIRIARSLDQKRNGGRYIFR